MVYSSVTDTGVVVAFVLADLLELLIGDVFGTTVVAAVVLFTKLFGVEGVVPTARIDEEEFKVVCIVAFDALTVVELTVVLF